MPTAIITPPIVSAVYEKIPVRVRRDSGDTTEPSVTVYFRTDFGDQTVTLTKSAGLNGYADFDLSGVLKYGFRNVRQPTQDYLIYDGRLTMSYSFKVGNTLYEEFAAIRQVQQFGHRRNLTAGNNMALVTMPMPLKRYPGYPTEITVMSASGDLGNTEVVLDGDKNFIGVAAMSLNLNWSDSYSLWVGGANGNPATTYPITVECIPEDPFYIRWLNELGGWDYRMFGDRKFIEDVVEDVDNIQKPERDNEYDTQETIGLTAYRYVEVGADQLGAEEFDALRKLGRSPLIQYWDVDAQAWFNIVLRKENTITSETDTPKAEINYVFQMQRIRLQF